MSPRPPPKISLKHEWKRELIRRGVPRSILDLAIKKGLTFYQTRSNAIILQETLPAYCVSKSCQNRNWRSHIREGVCVTSASSQDLNPDHIERCNPLSSATQGPHNVEEKRPVPRRSKHVLFMKKLFNMIERGNPLSALTQSRARSTPEHVHLMKARASKFKRKEYMIERDNHLSAVTQVTTQDFPKHVPFIKSTKFNVGDETNNERTE